MSCTLTRDGLDICYKGVLGSFKKGDSGEAVFKIEASPDPGTYCTLRANCARDPTPTSCKG